MSDLLGAQPMPQPLNVLMVEDNPADAELCLRELKKAGYDARVEVVQTAQDFTDRLRAGQYHVVLGDYTLPAAGQQPNDHIKALQPIVEKLNLDFEQYIPVHRGNAPQTKADLWKAVGK